MLHQLHMILRSRIGHTRSGARFLAPLSTWRKIRVRRDTDLCIEGFPRSANTFAVVALESCQPTRLTLAHHSHLAGQVLHAVALKIPTLVIVRNPLDAIASLHLRDPQLSIPFLLNEYQRFHKAILPVSDRMCIARFEQVIEDFGEVTQQLNARFGTEYEAFSHTQEHVDECMAHIEDLDRAVHMGGALSEDAVARPSVDRDSKKAGALHHIEQHEHLLQECRAMYESVLEAADSDRERTVS